MNDNAEIFIKSAGTHPVQGYQWWQLEANKPLIANEPDFIKELSSVDWLDREAFLLLILRNDRGLHLYVTGLATQGREDFQGRKIRNDLAITVHPDQESVLLDLACALLKDKRHVEKQLDQKIRPGKSADLTRPGFNANYNTIIQWIRSFSKSLSRIAPDKELESGRIAKNSEENRKALADLLEKYTLPHKTGYLIAVTRFSDPAYFLETPHWWRVLTDLETSPDWRLLYPKKSLIRLLAQNLGMQVGIMIAVALFLAVIGLKILETNGYEVLELNNSHSIADTDPSPVESPSPPKAPITYSLSICVNSDNVFDLTTFLSSQNGKLGNQLNQTSAVQKQEQN